MLAKIPFNNLILLILFSNSFIINLRKKTRQSRKKERHITDDDRRLVASDVTAYVHKNQFRVVPFPFKVRISKGDYVKRIISDKPV